MSEMRPAQSKMRLVLSKIWLRFSAQKQKSYEMDMCNGPLFGKILRFSIPLMLSGFLQLLFNAADMIVVGQFAGHEALAAVGSTSALISLLVNVFIGLSVGVNVVLARCCGAGDYENGSRTVHTAIALSLISGVALIFMGIAMAEPLLTLMGTPKDVLPQAVLYMRIYFLGMPVISIYNFGGAVLRAVGDTKRPLYYLLLAGVANVVLNLFFVIVCKMAVDGVAWATVLSQCISAGLILWCLTKMDGMCHLEFKRLHIYKDKFFEIIRIGVPAGLQGAAFSISNMIIQSSINSFGSQAMAGNTACANLEGIVHTMMSSVYQAALSFVGQNMGAGKYDRVKKTLRICLLTIFVGAACISLIILLFGRPLLSIYSNDDPKVIDYGFIRMQIIFLTYYLCGMADTTGGILRGMGYSIIPMVISLVGVCGLRIVWIVTVFVYSHSLFILYISYPISWLVTFAAHFICFLVVYRKLTRPPGGILTPKKERKGKRKKTAEA